MAGGKILGSECTKTLAENFYLESRLGGNFGLSGPIGGEGNGTPLQYFGLENHMNRGAWWAAVHRVTKSQT